jgi:hypothetical protein
MNPFRKFLFLNLSLFTSSQMDENDRIGVFGGDSIIEKNR